MAGQHCSRFPASLQVFLILSVVVLFPTSAAQGAESELVVLLTDDSTCYEHVYVTVDQLEAHLAGAGWIAVALTQESVDIDNNGTDDVVAHTDGSMTVDLIALNSVQTLFASGVLDPGHYTKLRLHVESAELVEDGTATPLKVPSGKVDIVGQFTIEAGQLVSLLLDFDAANSVVKKGGNKQPLLKPVIKLTSVQVVTEVTLHFDGSELTAAEASPAGDVLAVSNAAEGTVILIDAATKEVLATVPVGPNPSDLIFSPSGEVLVVTTKGTFSNPGNTVTIVDMNGFTTQTVEVGAGPSRIEFQPGVDIAYVLNSGGRIPDYRVSVVDLINPANPLVIATLVVGSAPDGISFSNDGTRAAITSSSSNTLHIIDAVNHAVVGVLEDVPSPSDVAFLPNMLKVAVANAHLGAGAALIDTGSLAVVKNKSAVGGMSHLLVHPDGTKIYALSNTRSFLQVLDATHGSFITGGRIAPDHGGGDISPDAGVSVMVLGETGTDPVLLIGATGGMLVLWNLTLDEVIGHIEVGGEITALSYNETTSEIAITLLEDVLFVDPDAHFAGLVNPYDDEEIEPVVNPTNISITGDTVLGDIVVLVDDGLSDPETSLAVDLGFNWQGIRPYLAEYQNVVNRFYAQSADIYDYLLIYYASDWREMEVDGAMVDLDSSVASFFHEYVRNFTRGLGFAEGERFDNHAEIWGYPTTRLQSVIFLNDLGEFNSDLTLLGGRSAVSLLAHELAHRFGAYADIEGNPILCSEGAGAYQHWAPTFNSFGSVLGGYEGNLIVDLGETVPGSGIHQFQVMAKEITLSDWDEYLLGLRTKEEVAPSFLIENPDLAPPYAIDDLIEGTRIDVTIDELIATNGPRFPDATLTQKVFHLGVCLVVPSGGGSPSVRQEDLDEVKNLVDAVSEFWRTETEGRGTLLSRHDSNLFTETEGDALIGGALTAGTMLPDGSKLYVADRLLDSILVFDADPTTSAFNTMTTMIEVGNNPTDVAVNGDGTLVLVTSETDAELTVIDTAPDTVATTIALSGADAKVAVGMNGPAAGRAYVSTDTTIDVVDLNLQQVVDTIVPVSPDIHDLELSPDGEVLLYTSGDLSLSRVTARSLVTGVESSESFTGEILTDIAVVQLESNPHNTPARAEASSSPPTLVYVSNPDRGAIQVFDLMTDPALNTFAFGPLPLDPDSGTAPYVSDIVTSSAPGRVAFSPGGNIALAATPDSSSIDVLCPADHNALATVDLADESRPMDLAFSLDGKRVHTVAARAAIDLGSLGVSYTDAHSLNNLGQVAGSSTGHAFIWSQEQGMMDIHPAGQSSTGFDINNLGQIAIHAYKPSIPIFNIQGWTRGYFWSQATGAIHLGDLGEDKLYARAINDQGHITGVGPDGAGQRHLFRWDGQQTGIMDLGFILNGYIHATEFLWAFNNLGQILIPFQDYSLGAHRGFVWTTEGGFMDIGTLGGNETRAYDLNELGQVVGRTIDANGAYHVFILTPLDTIGDPSPDTWFIDADVDQANDLMVSILQANTIWPYAINERGHVVGFYDTGTGEYHAFLWTPEDGLIDLHGMLGSGLSSNAPDINDFGQIIRRATPGPVVDTVSTLLTGRVKGLR